MRPRDLVLGLARQRREAGEPLLGAAVGAGLAAQAAAQGGADFILALNAGRYRMMGAPSVAAMLPLADANEFTFSFAESEILDRIDVPVVLGVSALGPVFNAGSIARRAAAAGFAGIANFPMLAGSAAICAATCRKSRTEPCATGCLQATGPGGLHPRVSSTDGSATRASNADRAESGANIALTIKMDPLVGADHDRVQADRGAFGASLESFVFAEVMKLMTASELRLSLYHFHDGQIREVGIVLERDDGMIVGIEVKASATVKSGDFGGLRALADACGDRFACGVVLYDSADVVPFGERLVAAPLSSLWA